MGENDKQELMQLKIIIIYVLKGDKDHLQLKKSFCLSFFDSVYISVQNQ